MKKKFKEVRKGNRKIKSFKPGRKGSKASKKSALAHKAAKPMGRAAEDEANQRQPMPGPGPEPSNRADTALAELMGKPVENY